jgi:hypothetical protein
MEKLEKVVQTQKDRKNEGDPSVQQSLVLGGHPALETND